ncbi:MAG: exosortase system-associated protein, TIGR04073 family [Candidatus Omnitrophica bacterium]|nr:exosortase system-associated protein, TIGR04073 family [Candidatus Omnitrophota bacterium]MBU1128742.1 exosortase system-associated protein, TIGR04073 family [Candidatus Omnitrophota bacterium]MBU1784002.1 exosortase system-associated protein, TIGR04073 family [Candidatus Omnitrophota bacterium]
MKKFLVLILVVAFAFTCTAVFALEKPVAEVAGQESQYPAGPMQKLGRGIGNMALGWTELPKGIINQTKETNLLQGLIFGTLKGACQTVARTVSGIADAVTFPFPAYDKSAISPAFDFPAPATE